MPVLETASTPSSDPPAAAPIPGGTRSSHRGVAPVNFRGRKVLLVDDDRLNIVVITNILQTEGYVIQQATSGEKALELYDSFQPDLVLLDVIMPGIDGFATCRELHQRYGESTAPVIFITAKNESEDVVEGLNAGGADYLTKPFHRKEALARIRTQLQNRELIAQQKSLVAELKKANAAKNKFLGMAAHDLRNPLASIRGLAEFLRDGTVGQLTVDQIDLVNTIHDTSQSMLTQVNELLDVATIEAGELKVQKEVQDLGELVAKSVYLNNINAARKQTQIYFEPPATPLQGAVDAQKIRQVMDNLLSNAVKYSPPGSRIRVTLNGDRPACKISVQDQGPGIPDSERHRLFKDFGILSARPTGGEKSTGLGLAICRKIVEAHRGAIMALNLPGGGCEFSILLPI